MMFEPQKPAWPRRLLTFRMLGLVLAIGSTFFWVKLWKHTVNPVQAYYLWSYVRTTVFADLPSWPSRTHKYPSYLVIETAGKPVSTASYLLNPTARPSLRAMEMKPAFFGAYLRNHIYDGRSLWSVLFWPEVGFGLCLVAFVATGMTLDRDHASKGRDGRLLRGPFLLSRWAFNRVTKGDGLRLRLSNRRNPLELMAGDRGRDLVIKREREAHHLQIAGDTGTGKSTLIRQILYQVEQRGDMAIVFDPDREYVKEFFNQERGDWVLNPCDDRCPYWPISEECQDEATATPIAMGFFPDAPTRQQFFLSHTRAIFAYLLATHKPTVNELAYWMAHPEEIDIRVKGTEHEHTLTANAAPQRAGILGSLNEAGKPLRMMPTHPEDGRRTWTVRQWAKERKGWLFITSTADTIDALRPLQSLWLDMLILKLQSTEARPGLARVWMVLDELASLNALPQLMSALTKQRKSNNPIVLGFQSMAQLAAAYGDKQSETILSQAFTNICLRTSEPRAAEHLSKLIGKAQLERIRESKPTHFLKRTQQGSYSSERVIDPVVMESQIQGLDDLNGYFVQTGKIVRIQFQPFARRERAPALIERVIPTGRRLDPPSASLGELTDRLASDATKDPTPKAPRKLRAPKQAIEQARAGNGLGAGEL